MNRNRGNNKIIVAAIAVVIVIVIMIATIVIVFKKKNTNQTDGNRIDTEYQYTEMIEVLTEQTEASEDEKLNTIAYSAEETSETKEIGEEIVSQHAVLIDLSNDTIVAEKGGRERINPASMTKVLTVLVAAEHLEDMSKLDDTVTMVPEITDYAFINGCSTAGFEKNEVVSVRDLFYGTILPSGGDAAVGLATYIAGSQEKFVELMNEKVDELGLAGSAHFTNCVGVYDEELYCSVYDMAMIMEAAMDNELCRDVLGAKAYTTSVTESHPEGIVLCNKLILRMNSKEEYGTIIGGKTGYVVQSGNCAVTFAVDDSGKEYICATGGSSSAWQCVYDHITLYDTVFQ